MKNRLAGATFPVWHAVEAKSTRRTARDCRVFFMSSYHGPVRDDGD